MPVTILSVVGTLNGFILPIMLTVIIIASFKKSIVGDDKHPTTLVTDGMIVILFTGYPDFQVLPHIVKLLAG